MGRDGGCRTSRPKVRSHENRTYAEWRIYPYQSACRKTHRQINGLDVFGQRAYRNKIDTGFGNGAHRVLIYAARGLELSLPTGQMHRMAQMLQIKIIQQNAWRSGHERFFELGEVFDFNFER